MISRSGHRLTRAQAAVLVLLLLIATGASIRPLWMHEVHGTFADYHSDLMRSAYGGLPDTTNSLFTGSGKCAGCHSTDPNSFASLAGQSFPAVPIPDAWDVNPTDMWRATMMANSAKDPFWRAKVSQEVAINPGHQLILEDKCTSCHAPLGNFAAHHDGEEFYTMAMLAADSLALDGVSCVACHQQEPEGLGTSFSGQLSFVQDTVYGPYGGTKDEPELYALPMQTFVDIDPVFGAHISESVLCADCHTLVTETVDLSGEFTGAEFVEQATYHEWLNSRFAPDQWEGETNALQATCQDCHMPQIDDPVIISSGYAFLEPRSPYGLHYLVGANAQMLRLLRDHIDELGLTADEAHFDSTIARTLDLLQNESVELSLAATFDDLNGAMEVRVGLRNKTGHKFPSGYPARRMWIELSAVHPSTGAVLWSSGSLASDGYNIVGADDGGLAIWDPHHDESITAEEDVQIYEMVMGNVEGDPTIILERAAYSLKDNRLPPLGFSTEHASYDTTMLAGAGVLADLATGDFNRYADGTEGSGADTTRYAFSVPEATDWVPDVRARIWYQSMPPRWIEPMFETTTPEIEVFEAMYYPYAAPDLITEMTISPVSITVPELTHDAPWWLAAPNPTAPSHVPAVPVFPMVYLELRLMVLGYCYRVTGAGRLRCTFNASPSTAPGRAGATLTDNGA